MRKDCAQDRLDRAVCQHMTREARGGLDDAVVFDFREVSGSEDGENLVGEVAEGEGMDWWGASCELTQEDVFLWGGVRPRWAADRV